MVRTLARAGDDVGPCGAWHVAECSIAPMPDPLIVTLGDVLALVLVTPAEGMMAESATTTATQLTVGGQAAICACWAVETGAGARAISARSYDRVGDLVEASLAERGVDLEGPGVEGVTGVATVIRSAGAQRTALTDRGVCPLLSAEALQAEWFEDADVLYVSGYALIEEPSAGAAEAACALARASRARICVDLACADIVSPLVRERIARLRADVALATAAQAEAIGGIDDLAALPIISGVEAVPVIDPMGVADAFAAGFLAALAAGVDADDARDLGYQMVERCGAVEGPLP
jgi:sugar/nucleoside kinase (ribokinase family)